MLQELGPQIWCSERSARHLGLATVERTTVLRLGSDELLLHAPEQPSPELRGALEHLGRVRYLVAPNRWTKIDPGGWSGSSPELTLIAPARWRSDCPRVAGDGTHVARVELVRPATGIQSVDQDLGVAHVDGIGELDEWLFVHRPSRTLLVGDLVRGVEHEGSLVGRLLRASALGRGPLGTPRDVRWLVDDRAALARSVEAILRWEFDRVVPRRGPVVERDGRAALRRALEWVNGSRAFWQ